VVGDVYSGGGRLRFDRGDGWALVDVGVGFSVGEN
jgi:hypothetical protein